MPVIVKASFNGDPSEVGHPTYSIMIRWCDKF